MRTRYLADRVIVYDGRHWVRGKVMTFHGSRKDEPLGIPIPPKAI